MLLDPANHQLRKTNIDWLIYSNQTLGFTFLCWFKLGSHWTKFQLLNSASMYNSLFSFLHDIRVDRCAGTTVSRYQMWGQAGVGVLKCPRPRFLIEGYISLQNALWYSICTLISKKGSPPAEGPWTPPGCFLSLLCLWITFIRWS